MLAWPLSHGEQALPGGFSSSLLPALTGPLSVAQADALGVPPQLDRAGWPRGSKYGMLSLSAHFMGTITMTQWGQCTAGVNTKCSQDGPCREEAGWVEQTWSPAACPVKLGWVSGFTRSRSQADHNLPPSYFLTSPMLSLMGRWPCHSLSSVLLGKGRPSRSHLTIHS